MNKTETDTSRRSLLKGVSALTAMLGTGLVFNANAAEVDHSKMNHDLPIDPNLEELMDYVLECIKMAEICQQHSMHMFQMGDTKLNEDVVVPIKHYHDLIQYTLELREQIKLATPTFGHVADGNFHVHIMYDHRDSEQCKRAEQGLLMLMKKIVEFGGAITGEHGIGLAKSPFLRLQHNPAEIKIMQGIKKLFDLNNILNPGKIFEPFEMWQHQRDYDIVFPWDHGRTKGEA